MQDSIIVYRNPMEKAMWEGMQNGGFGFIVLFVVAFFIGFGITYFIISKFVRGADFNRWSSGVSIFVGFMCAGMAIYFWP